MKFYNSTPFAALCFHGWDLACAEFRVVALKVGYRLVPHEREAGRLVAKAIVRDRVELCLRDEYYGELNRSCVREESDLAHYKPRCDVIVRGAAHAPHGRPVTQWDARIKVSVPHESRHAGVGFSPLPAGMRPSLTARYAERWPISVALGAFSHSTQKVLLDKSLRISGPREFIRESNAWRVSAARATASVPLRWEYAFGGSSVVRNPRYGEDPEAPEHLLNEACYVNPLGCGWIEQRHDDALEQAGQEPLRAIPAPQIEAPGAAIVEPVVIRHPDTFDATDPNAFIRIAQGYGRLPAGLGIVGRPWAPRLQLGGTYGAIWVKERWPYWPDDHDFGYWNCAPRDQQIDAPPPDARIEMWNLADQQHAPHGYAWFELPGDLPLVWLHTKQGDSWPMPMTTDTVLIDTDAMTLTLVHRFQFVETADIARADAVIVERATT